MYCIWMNERVPGRSGATNMQMERLIAPKIKMTNISRIPAFLEQHSWTLGFSQRGPLKADTGYLAMKLLIAGSVCLYSMTLTSALPGTKPQVSAWDQADIHANG